MKTIISYAGMFVMACAMLASCNKDVAEQNLDGAQAPETRAVSVGNTPKVMVYYEINDTNPLNALCYEMSNGEKFIDIVQLFASNIQKQTVGGQDWPCIKFNDKLTPVMANASTYIAPLRAAGMKVILNVLGNWDQIGVSNLTPAQADAFANILVYIVDTYNLDGIGFDDEYSNVSSTKPNSYAHVIKALHAKLDQKFGVGAKMITVFQWGAYHQIDAAAGAMIDIADHGYFAYNRWLSSSSISGMQNNRWSPMSINMGQSYTLSQRNTIKANAQDAADLGYGAMMMFNVRKKSDVNPQPVFQAIATGAFGETITNVAPFEYSQDWTPATIEHYITKDDVPAYQPTYTGN